MNSLTTLLQNSIEVWGFKDTGYFLFPVFLDILSLLIDMAFSALPSVLLISPFGLFFPPLAFKHYFLFSLGEIAGRELPLYLCPFTVGEPPEMKMRLMVGC